jgi:membrane fusion protein (multidrug efflux system)
VRAPFSGRLGIRAVNLGQYVNPGTTLTTLESLEVVYVDFSVPQQELADVAPKTPVRVSLSGSGDAVCGRDCGGRSGGRCHHAVGEAAGEHSQPEREQLRPGMFVRVAVVLPQRKSVVAAPVTAVVHASYGDSVFVVEDTKEASGAPVLGAHGRAKWRGSSLCGWVRRGATSWRSSTV